jgi:hypothetical protein
MFLLNELRSKKSRGKQKDRTVACAGTVMWVTPTGRQARQEEYRGRVTSISQPSDRSCSLNYRMKMTFNSKRIPTQRVEKAYRKA